MTKPSMLQEAAISTMENHLRASRGDHEGTSSATSPRETEVIRSLAPFFAGHERIVFGMLGNLTPDTDLRDLALAHGLSDLADFAAPNANTDEPKTLAAGDRTSSASPGHKEAVAFRRELFQIEPTGVVQRMVIDDEVGSFPSDKVRQSVVKFMENQSRSFDISRTSVHVALRNANAFAGIPADQHSEVSDAVKGLQTAQAIAVHPETIKPLREAGLSTAFAVSSMSEKGFVESLSGKVDADVAKAIHLRANNSRIRNDHALVSLLQTTRGTGIAALDGNVNLEDRKKMLASKLNRAVSGRDYYGSGDGQEGADSDIVPKPVVDLEALFGSLDYCECSDCNSVNSPAAYFVEVLQFLRNNNLHWDKNKWRHSGDLGIEGTALNALFARRPDLGNIELTCANTNTVLPYIDLANEVMESFVVHQQKYAEDQNNPKRVTLDVFNVEDEVSSELLAEPQHTNYTAYCILKDAVYPIVNAPYHQALDETRILLEYMGISRYELITTFPAPYVSEDGRDPPSADALKLRDQYSQTLDRIASSEFWKMTQTEYIAITRQSYWSKEFWVIKKKAQITDDEYQSHIRRKPAWVYWGYDNEAEMQANSDTKAGLMFVKAQLLQRAYVTYADLVGLVKTRYINPNMPMGRNRIILESIQFSYKYLRTLVDWERDDNKKFRRLAKFLASWKPWAKRHGVELELCEDDDSTLFLCEPEILCWLKTWFEAVGKLVVLESGDVPLLPIEGHLVLYTEAPVPHLTRPSHSAIPPSTDSLGGEWQDVGYLGRDGKVRKENRVEVAHVSPDGTLCGNDGTRYTASLHSGQSIYIVDPTVTSFQNSEDILQNHILARVLPSTSVVIWNMANPQEDQQPVPIHYLAATETCNIDNVTIQHLDGSQLTVDEWDRTQAFLRLWRRVAWTIDELDRALAGIAQSSASSDTPTDGTSTDVIDDWNQVIDSNSCQCPVCGHANSDCCCKKPDTPDSHDCCDLDGPEPPIYITPETLEQLVSIKQLVDLSGLPLTQLLTLWYGIPIEGDPSLYSKLFLVHNISSIDQVFKATSDGDYLTTPTKISDHLPVILAALRINAETLAAIMKDAQVPDDLTLDTISTLYRYTVLGRLLSVKPILLPRIISICSSPFVDPKTTLEVTQLWQQIRDKGYTLAQMDYLLNNIKDPLKPLGPTMATVLKATKTLMDGIFQINTEHADVSAAETSATITTLLAAKIPLIFDPDVTSAILGLLNGTTAYTTDAPPNLDIKIPDSLKAKLQYVTLTKLTPVRATVTVTGILTAEEMAAAKALSTNSDWATSLARIVKKPSRFFDETLFGIFPDREAAKAVLLLGDVPPPPPPPPPTDPSQTSLPPGTTGSPPVDKSTAGPKSLFFLQGLLPFLRKTLADRLIIDTVSGATSISDPDLRVLLLSKLIKVGSDSKLAIDALRDIAESPPVSQSSFSGYLVPNATGDFTFVAGGFNMEPPPLLIDNQPVRLLHQQEDPSNVWNSDPISLTSGKLYDFTVSGQPASNLQWKTARSPVSNIPKMALLPGHASDSTMDVFTRLYKASLMINIMGITMPEVDYISSNAADFSNVNFNGFTLDTWRRLAAYTTLRDSLPVTNLTLMDFFKWAKKPGKPQNLAGQISAVTTWNKDVVSKLIAKDALNLVDVSTWVNEVHLVELQKAMAVQTKIGVEPDLLFKWSKPLSFFWKEARAVAESIRKTLRARYDVATWEQVAQPLFNTLRCNQQDALIAFLLVQKPLRQWGVRDADSLFEFFLIDVQMGSCLQTSRIKQAISTAQLFVQRCLLALEDDHGVAGFSFDKQRWSWMQNYRVWEANRKVFLWPENWLNPTLRDDKSELFQALESQLLQKDLNPRALQDALKQYLFGVDQVSNLQVIGLVVNQTSSILHIFAKTIAAPYFYFYRRYQSFATGQGNWSPWETMQVDIVTYEDEDEQGKVKNAGSYLLPVIWNGRLLAFLPEFCKKTIPIRVKDNDMSIRESGEKRMFNASTPATYWSIKLAYTEYRNGKWTPKKVSSGEVSRFPDPPPPPPPPPPSPPTREGDSPPPPTPPPPGAPILPPLSSYRFVPKSIGASPDNTIMIGAFNETVSNAIGWFEFDGGQVYVVTSPAQPFTLTTSNNFQFHFQSTSEGTLRMRSYQDDPSTNGELEFMNRDPTVEYVPGKSPQPQITTSSDHLYDFYDPLSRKLLMRSTTAPTVDGVYEFYRNITDLEGLAAAFGNPVKPATPFGAYHELKTPYALYNWEIALHAPMLLVNKLLSIQKFDEALAVAKWVFDPFADRSSPPVPGDLWHFPPFKNVLAENELEKTFAMLEPNTVVEQGNIIGEWRDNPFEPHVVARSRRQAYMKWFAMHYIEILIAYGDWYFMQNTLETIPMAIQLYVQASHLYGRRAQRIPQRGKKKIETYNSLLNQWDSFSNAVVQMELAFPFSQQSDKPLGELHGKQVLANIFGFATSRYFCVPNNPKLDEVRNLIDDRLYKIRHCQDINGIVRQLPLFEPPIDPGLLVQAAAAGLSFASVISDLNSPMGNYRFPLLLQKALELCNELKSFSSIFLSVKEKRDAEALSKLRAVQEVTVAGLVMEMKKQALEDANLTLAALQRSRLAPVSRMKHFIQLLGEDTGKVPSEDADFSELQNRYEPLADNAGFKLTDWESQDIDKANTAALESVAIGEVEALSSFLHMIPTTNISNQPWGFGFMIKWGPASFAQGAAGTARKMRILTDWTSAEGANASRMANFLRQLQDRVHQANNAGHEIKNIDAQIRAQEQKVAIAEQDIKNQQQVMDNAAEVHGFLRDKYTNEALYAWMENGIRSLYYQTYTLAYQLAKKAERAYAFERALDSSQASFVQFGYWDPNRDGLLAAERLYVGLKQLEAAHQADRGHDYEITKHVSLRQLAPLALLQLRASGTCEVALPEVLFDMDFPGHFQRRIRSVALTIPCVVGPYTSLSCTLRLLGSEMRVLPTAGSAADYPRAGGGGSDGGDDLRFRTVTSVPIASIAVSSASNDAGVFELGFRDERYTPFEGAGAISRWRLELPAVVRTWDYGSIADVVMHLRYTSREGGEKLGSAAAGAVADFVKRAEAASRDDGLFVVFDLRSEFATEWSRVVGPPATGASTDPRPLALKGLSDRLPVFTKVQAVEGKAKMVTAEDVWVLLSKGGWVNGVELVDAAGNGTDLPAGPDFGGMAAFLGTGAEVEIGDWVLNLRGTSGQKLTKGLVVVRYIIT
ncbi:hypothetical protein BFJ71_g15130 [Fusarium oxysporum]|nr:hypothetical protein BFJ71_g15130 [Fusarium oxysporum]